MATVTKKVIYFDRFRQEKFLMTVKKITKMRRNNKPISFNTFYTNGLLTQLTIEDNFLFQSKLVNLERLVKLANTPQTQEIVNNYIINFRNFYPNNVPDELKEILSFYSFILKDTDYGVYLPPPVISEDENLLANLLFDHMTTKIGRAHV